MSWSTLASALSSRKLQQSGRVALPVITNGNQGHVLLCYTGSQNAAHRLFTLMLEEHSCSIGFAGLHNLLLFGSDILTREIASAKTSTKSLLLSAGLLPELRVEETGPWSSPVRLLVIALLLSDSRSALGVGCLVVNLKL